MKQSKTQDHYTTYERDGQVVLALNNEIILSENAPVRLTSAQLEELDYRQLYRAYSPKGRKSAADPRVTFKVMAYGYQCGIYSSRGWEEACRYRVDFMWLLEGEPVPDHATFARFRKRCAKEIEDLFYMRNGQLKPAYNVQIAVNSEYITGIDVFSDRTDFGTLVPFLKTLQRQHRKRYDSVTADAGYERLGNYLFLESNGQMSFIKPANYEYQKSAKYKKQLGRMENMTYDADEDCYICANGRRLPLRRECTELQNGREVTTAYYRCEDCKGCTLREKCCQAKDTEQPKELRVNKTLQELRKASQENITTERGIYLRLCRSIQVEGAFGLLKTDFGFRRFLTRGKANVRTELFLLALAFDLKKLWMKRENGRLQTHLSQLNSA